MRIIKIRTDVNVESLYVRATCPECNKQYGFHLRKAITRKTCPCAHSTFIFTTTALRGGLGIFCIVVRRNTEEVEINVDEIEIAPIELEDDDAG